MSNPEAEACTENPEVKQLKSEFEKLSLSDQEQSSPYDN